MLRTTQSGQSGGVPAPQTWKQGDNKPIYVLFYSVILFSFIHTAKIIKGNTWSSTCAHTKAFFGELSATNAGKWIHNSLCYLTDQVSP